MNPNVPEQDGTSCSSRLKNVNNVILRTAKAGRRISSIRFMVNFRLRFFPFVPLRVRMTIMMLIFLACEIPEVPFDNPLDTDNTIPPALVFYPDKIETTVGGTVVVNVYALEVTGVGGVHAQIQYDNTKLTVSSVSLGSFFSGSQAPIFIYEDNAGVLDIFSFYLGGNGESVSGTGDVALVVFNTRVPGQTQIQFTTESELVDPDDQPIQLNGLGKGVVNAN